MSTYLIQDSTLSSMADAIRLKGGTSTSMAAAQMASRIDDIETGVNTVAPYAYVDSTISEFSSNAVYVLDEAFARCTMLSSVNMPNASYIQSSAFSSCANLETIVLPKVESIPYYMFSKCASLKTLIMPKLTFYSSAFASCVNLETVEVRDLASVETDLSSFANIKNLAITEFTNPNYIYIDWFSSCYENLESISIHWLVSSNIVGDMIAFNLESHFKYINLTLDGEYNITPSNRMFFSCTGLLSAIIDIQRTSTTMFQGCKNLNTLVLPKIASMSASTAFSGCTNLYNLYLPNSSIFCALTQAVERVFNTTPIYSSDASGRYGSIYVPAELYSSYITGTNWATISSRIVSI